ncbi:hypothetical protein Tco_1099289 [Tanacetum coccineum]
MVSSIKGVMTTEHANKANSENRLLSQVTEREILAAELSCHSRCQLRDRTTMQSSSTLQELEAWRVVSSASSLSTGQLCIGYNGHAYFTKALI